MKINNFFKSIAAIDFAGNLQITIAKSEENTLVVSVLLQNTACGDNAKNLIPPLTLIGTADELDDGFFTSISAPLQQASGLMLDMESFLAGLELAKQQSAIEKHKGEKERKEKQAKDKKYTDAMAKVEALEKEGKFREAWTKLPDPAEYPEYLEAIRKRKSELSARFAPDLFGAPAEKPEIMDSQGEDMAVLDEGDDSRYGYTPKDEEE